MAHRQIRLGVMKINGTKLKQLREDQVLTMRELAKKAGVSVDAINRLEKNRTGAQQTTIRKLAKALDVEPQELVK